MEPNQEYQTIYGFQTLLKGYAPSMFNITFENKKELITFVTTKDAIVEGSTFEMHGENDSYFNEISDVVKFEKRTLHIFEMKLFKKNETNGK